MRLLTFFLVLVSISMMSGCETAYQPVESYGGIPFGGYTDNRIDQNTAIVTFRANDITPGSTVKSYLYYRCSEITIANGYDYFVITSMTDSPLNVNLQTDESFNGYVTDPPRFITQYPDIVRVKSYNLSETATLFPRRSRCQGARCPLRRMVAVIKMFRGSMPYGLPNAFNARDIAAHLGASAL